MRLCLECRRASPGGSAFCGHCARSFGGRLCQNRHRNTPHARCCTTCGSPQLTEYARSLRLGWVPAGLAGLCALGAWKWLVAHPAPLLGAAWGGATWLLGVLLNAPACAVRAALRQAVVLLAACWLAGHGLALIPGAVPAAAGRVLRAVPAWVARQTLRALGASLRFALRRLLWALWPPPKKAAPGKAGTDGHGG